MKIKAMLAMAALAGSLAQAAEKKGFEGHEVTICVKRGIIIGSDLAQSIAGKMFEDIGIKIDWLEEHNCPAGGKGFIHISYDTGLPEERFPGAMAFAMPYEGVHIHVFVDRLRKSLHPRTFPYMLAHVLAHEITHILQGINRHSKTGVMKAKWSYEDIREMSWKPLPFAEEDIRLIHLGMDAWATRSANIDHLLASTAKQGE
jgi:hypothetical protein